MKLHYYPDTDTLYISLRDHASVDSQEVSAGIVLDFGADGSTVGIEIEDASEKVDLSSLEAVALPESRLAS